VFGERERGEGLIVLYDVSMKQEQTQTEVTERERERAKQSTCTSRVIEAVEEKASFVPSP
jgi:DNA-binding GntR family transcriptional regulator